MSTKIEKSIKKTINKIANEEAVLAQDSLHSKQALVQKNKQELEDFFLMSAQEKDSLIFAIELLSDIGFELFDSDSVNRMEEFKQKISNHQFDADEKISLKDMIGIKKEKLEDIYELALIMLEGELYPQARDLFLFIIQLDPYYTNSWIGLGQALQALKQYDNAVRIYSYLTHFEKNPEVFIEAIQCCIDGGQIFNAKTLMHELQKLNCNKEQTERIQDLQLKLNKF